MKVLRQDIDSRIEMQRMGLEILCYDHKEGRIDYDKLMKENEKIIEKEWAREGEYMRMESEGRLEQCEYDAKMLLARLQMEADMPKPFDFWSELFKNMAIGFAIVFGAAVLLLYVFG